LFVLALLAACGGNSDSSGIPAACNPLGGAGCMLPWPSMAYAKVDSSSATGFRLDVPSAAMPVNVDGIPVDSAWLDRWDGFSAIGPILVAFDTGVSVEGLPGHQDPDASLAASSPIVLVDMNTGERAPFFAEIDQNTIDVTKRNLIIRPLMRLHTSSRYAVAIRKTVKAADGGELAIPPAFQAILDGKSFDHPKFAAISARYPEIFSALATAGVDKSELVLAWDFVTVSDDYLRSDLTTMRAAALPAIGTNGANLTFAATVQPNSATSFKRYLGTFKSPDFLTAGETDPSILRRDASNLPQLQGMRDAQFAAIIPGCVATQPLPRPTIIFGHGLFGSAEEYLNDSFVAQLAEDHCLVIIAGDWIGLTSRQFPLAPLAVNDLNRGPQITEKLAQSIIDFISLESIARGPMATSPEFQFNGQPVIDPAKTYYVGGSLGGIMGNTFMAYDPNITRGVLAVPGGNWSLLLERSTAWGLLLGASQGAYEDPEVYQLNLALALGMGFESIDPMTTAAHVIKDPLFGNPLKNILMWYSMGDCLVTNISTEMVAREMGIQMLAPSVRSPWGLTPVAGPLANGITVFNDHPTPLPLDTNVPPITDNGTHSGINRKPAALREVQEFLIQNAAANECLVNNVAAPCDCATGACD
jgi:pimeloyl-ACP methyl ester carboxylesterase